MTKNKLKSTWEEHKPIIIALSILLSLALYVVLFNKGIICFPDCDGCTPKNPCGVTISGFGDSAKVIVERGDEIIINDGGSCG